jgi:hypothetical protein
MPCNQQNLLTMTVGKVTPVPLREANPVTPSRYLVVSNARETITPDTWNGDTNPIGQLYSGVPPIRHETTQPPNTINAVRIRRSDLPILPNTSAPCTIQNATAGGARMPVDLRLVASPVATPINEGGP